jgi:hypothetical protein
VETPKRLNAQINRLVVWTFYRLVVQAMQFEELNMRKDSQELFIHLSEIFTKESFKDYFFKDQILRASLSISNNIAE